MPRRTAKPLPFNADLGGVQRVARSFARKAWSMGLPVWQDAGRGAVMLERPCTVPAPGVPGRFDKACLDAAPHLRERYGIFTDAARRRCTYLVRYGAGAIHFTFRDGSNPFVKYGTAAELVCELEAWSRRWDLRPSAGTDPAAAACFELEERCPAPMGLFSPGP